MDRMNHHIPIYLVVGCPGAGKSWVCSQLRDLFEYVEKDLYMKGPKDAYLNAILATLAIAEKPLIIETNFSMSELLEPLESAGYDVTCLFIEEDDDVIAKRYEAREGKPIPKGHLTRQRTYYRRAIELGAFMGTAEEVLAQLKKIAQILKAA